MTLPDFDPQQTKDLFLEALDLDGQDREQFLARLQDSDPTQFERVRRLLGAHASSEGMELAIPSPRPRKAIAESDLDRIGEQVGQYELLEIVGSGGAGVVYRARQHGLERHVALKLLRMGRFASKEEVRRFKAEAESVSRLDHSNIVPLHEVGEHEGRHYFSMKLIEGGSLSDRLDYYQTDPRAAASLVSKVSRAIQHAHDRGLLHRDLKPSNILLDPTGHPYVADFGIAKQTEGGQSLTRSGWMAGTPGYMAPEQFGNAGEATVRTDVYGLGCILFEALTGHPAFEGDSAGDVMQRVWSERVKFSETEQQRIPRDLRTICLKCLEKEPGHRYESAAALGADLGRWLSGEPIEARTVPLPERILLLWKRKPMVTSLAASVIFLLVAMVVGVFVGSIVLNESYKRAVKAETDAKLRLRDAHLAEAQALRLSRKFGRRYEALDRLKLAHAIRPGQDLRNEAIACLAVADLRLEWSRAAVLPHKPVADFDFERGRYAVGTEDGDVRLYRMADGERLEHFTLGEGRRPWGLRFSPDGRYLTMVAHIAGGHANPRFVLADLDQNRWVLDLEKLGYGGAARFSRDGSEFALAMESRVMSRIDPATGEILGTLELNNTPADMSYSYDGRYLAVAYRSDGIDIFDLDSGELVHNIESERTFYSVDWSADGRWLAAGHSGSRAYVYDTESFEVSWALKGHFAEVVETCFFEGGRYLATYSWDNRTRLFDMETGEMLVHIEAHLVCTEAEGRRLVMTSEGDVQLAEFGHEDVFRSIVAHERKGPTEVEVDPSGRYLITTAPDGLMVWDWRTGKRLASRMDQGYGGVEFDPQTGDMYVTTLPALLRWPGPIDPEQLTQVEPEVVVEERCSSLKLEASSRMFACRIGGEIRVFSLDDAQERYRFKVRGGTAGVWFAPGGEWLLAGSWRGAGAQLWNVAEGQLERNFMMAEPSVGGDFCADGVRVILGSATAYQQWNFESGELEWEVSRGRRFGESPGKAVYSPDGRIVSIKLDRTRLDLMDVASGEQLFRLEAPALDPPTAQCFVDDNRTLIVATTANRVHIWNLEAIDRNLGELGLFEPPVEAP